MSCNLSYLHLVECVCFVPDIKVILDFVPNHSSNESDWFIKSSNRDEYYSDWYIWENGHLDDRGQRSPPNNWVREHTRNNNSLTLIISSI